MAAPSPLHASAPTARHATSCRTTQSPARRRGRALRAAALTALLAALPGCACGEDLAVVPGRVSGRVCDTESG
ncbi:MAG: hypothetical protein IT382_16665, partial [Deltaproteobacteria bacterium]|nr:hypothetical protein [Deltaproteobacteria bacterium]